MATVDSIDHANIVVRDMDTSTAFYTQLLGFRERTRATLEGEWIEKITGLSGAVAEVCILEPQGGGARLELLQYREPPALEVSGSSLPCAEGLRHLAFRVADIDGIVARLRSAGVRFVSDPTEVPALSVTFDRPVRKRLCYFYDPDGVLLEFAEYRPLSPATP